MDSVILATGRRKEAIARVIMRKGTGKISVNGKKLNEYFGREYHIFHAFQPVIAANLQDKYDFECKVKGGGHTGQAGAIRLGIARAISKIDESLKKIMATGKFLTRDPRMVERKKYGRMKARRRYQFSKR